LENSEFYKQLKNAVSFFHSKSNGVIRLISHYDADGICSAAIMISTLNRLGINYSITIIPQLDYETLKTFANEDYSFFIFTDIGSAHTTDIKNLFSEKNVLILDHHRTKKSIMPDNVCHINPHLYGLNGSREIAGAGVVYLFSEILDEKNKNLSHLAIIGAIGDCQERKGFFGLNSEILKKATKAKRIQVTEGLRLFGAQSKPLFKLLRQSFDPYIPGVSGTFSGTNDFLKSLNINPKVGNTWKMLSHLTELEIKRLTKGIREKIADNKKKKLIGNIYLLPHIEEGPFHDAREFSTILNSCGRLNKATVGIGAAIGDDKMKKKAITVLSSYKREILNIMDWFKQNRKSKSITETENYLIINAKDNIISSMAGTFASIISHSNDIEKGKYILSMSRMENDTTKISMRVSGGTHGTDIDLFKALSEMVKTVDGQSGGHKNAAGAVIDSSKEKNFIKSAVKVFNKLSMEERIE